MGYGWENPIQYMVFWGLDYDEGFPDQVLGKDLFAYRHQISQRFQMLVWRFWATYPDAHLMR